MASLIFLEENPAKSFEMLIQSYMNVMFSEKYKCDVGEGDFSHLKQVSFPYIPGGKLS